MIQVGDWVKIKTYDRLKKEFPAETCGTILCTFGFTLEMKCLSGLVGRVRSVSGDEIFFTDDNPVLSKRVNEAPGHSRYFISQDMVVKVKPPMEGGMIREGDWVKIKTWDRLKKEFGVRNEYFQDEYIPCNPNFTRPMRQLSGLIGKVERVSYSTAQVIFTRDNPKLFELSQRYFISTDMVYKVKSPYGI